MTEFDRLAWYCSVLAPVGWTVAALAFVLSLVMARPALPDPGLIGLLPIIALGAASLGLIANAVLVYHVLKAGVFSAEERSALLLDLWLGIGYQRWRSTMRDHRT